MKASHWPEYLNSTRRKQIASFGKARLLRYPNGRFELHGGSPNDRQTAREWVSFFLHEATIRV